MSDLRWLEQRWRCWYAVLDVPRPLRAVMGRKRLVKSLKTTDLPTARIRRYAALAEFQATIAKARAGTGLDAVDQAANAAREMFNDFDRGDFSKFHVGLPKPDDMTEAEFKRSTAGWLLHDQATEIGHEHGEEAERRFRALAIERQTPLLHYADAWLNEGGQKGPLKSRTRNQYRSDLQFFADWVRQSGVPRTIENATKPVVGGFVTEALIGGHVDPKTANRRISACSAYWRWLIKRTSTQNNPWTGQRVAKPQNVEKPKRAFTDGEMAALLSGGADPELSDAMRIAALSGMRIEEIYRLTVADCANGRFSIRLGKTSAARRTVPIHSALTDIVTRRCQGKKPVEYLFHEAGQVKEGRERSMVASKRFGYYRRRIGVDEAVEGRRQGRIDFHSFRRWFITAARNAGNDKDVVARLVGHESEGMTDGVYSSGATNAMKIRGIETVRLPDGGCE